MCFSSISKCCRRSSEENAQALSKNDAAILVEEKNIDTELFESINLLVKDVDMQKKLGLIVRKWISLKPQKEL